LHLDDPVLVKPDRQAAEKDDHHAGKPQQRRNLPIAERRKDHRDDHGDHECPGGDEDFHHRRHRRQEIDQKEDQQGPEVDQELARALRLFASAHSAGNPAMARATARGSKGLRSSAVSPTPMAWIGSPNFSAAATRIPPRAVPSSLVMMRPVTPAVSRNTSTWA